MYGAVLYNAKNLLVLLCLVALSTARAKDTADPSYRGRG